MASFKNILPKLANLLVTPTIVSSTLLMKSYCDIQQQQKSTLKDHSSDVVMFRPDSSKYERIDNLLDSSEFLVDHALHETLNGKSLIEVYEIYRKVDHDEILCIIKFGKSLNGYPGIVHGGITALVIDNSYGWLFNSLHLPSAFTANLNVNYRAPITADSFSILRARVDRVEGRKLFMTCTVEDAVTGRLQADSTTLFVNFPASAAVSANK